MFEVCTKTKVKMRPQVTRNQFVQLLKVRITKRKKHLPYESNKQTKKIKDPLIQAAHIMGIEWTHNCRWRRDPQDPWPQAVFHPPSRHPAYPEKIPSDRSLQLICHLLNPTPKKQHWSKGKKKILRRRHINLITPSNLLPLTDTSTDQEKRDLPSVGKFERRLSSALTFQNSATKFSSKVDLTASSRSGKNQSCLYMFQMSTTSIEKMKTYLEYLPRELTIQNGWL